MVEKNTQETTMPEDHHADAADKAKDMQIKPVDKGVTVVPLPVTPAEGSPRFSMPSFTKTPPTDLYKKLLPAGLFLMTFVTVMTILLIYMDTVALDAQQFRLNMTRDYELERIPQESEALVAFVRQLHLAVRPPQASASGAPPAPTRTVRALDNLYGEIYNGTFVEFLPSGPREPTTRYLEGERGWRGVAARGAAVDYLALRGAARGLHACLSPTPHPREVTYHESAGGSGSAFSSRVLCLPLYTVLAAGGALRAHYTLLAGAAVYPALTHLPFDKVHLQTIEVRASDLVSSYKITKLLESKNYTIAETFDDGILYALKD